MNTISKAIITHLNSEGTWVGSCRPSNVDLVFALECRKIDPTFPLDRSDFEPLLKRTKMVGCYHPIEVFCNDNGYVKMFSQSDYYVSLIV